MIAKKKITSASKTSEINKLREEWIANADTKMKAYKEGAQGKCIGCSL